MASNILALLRIGVCLLLVVGALATGTGLASAETTCSFPVSTTDATDESVEIAEEPTRIVTLAPSVAQTLWEIGARDAVVGVTPHASYLSGTDSLPTVTTFPGVDVETVVDLDPDLVLAPNVIADDDIETMRRAGLTVYKFDAANTIEDVYAKTRLTGRLVGECAGADETVSWMQTEIETTREATEDRSRPRVFHHLGGGWTAGEHTFIHEILRAAGGENVAATAGIDFYGVMSAEVLLATDPEWIVRGRVPVPDEPPYSETTAMKRSQIITVDPNYMNQPAPRIVYPIVTIANALHPDVDITVDDGHGVNADLTTQRARISTTTDGEGSVTIEVDRLYRERSVSLELPTSAGVNDEAVYLRSINLTLDRPNPSFTVTVRPVGVDETPPSLGDGTTPIRQFSLETNGIRGDDVDRVTFRISADRGSLADRQLEPRSLALYRATGDTWEPLDSRVQQNGSGSVTLTANATGTSRFALVADRATVDISDVSLEEAVGPEGTAVSVRVELRNPTSVPLDRAITAAIGNESVTRHVRLEPGATRTVTLGRTVRAPGTHRVLIDGQPVGVITVDSGPDRRTPSAPDTDPGPSPSPAVTPIRSEGQPGFGFVLAVVAVTVALVYRYRGARP